MDDTSPSERSPAHTETHMRRQTQLVRSLAQLECALRLCAQCTELLPRGGGCMRGQGNKPGWQARSPTEQWPILCFPACAVTLEFVSGRWTLSLRSVLFACLSRGRSAEENSVEVERSRSDVQTQQQKGQQGLAGSPTVKVESLEVQGTRLGARTHRRLYRSLRGRR